MIIFRIAQQSFIRDLTGRGAYLYGGRWSMKGTPAIYAASTKSLAYLEYLVHQFERDTWPDNLFISSIEISHPSAILTIERTKLPSNWKDLKYNGDTQQIATQYFMNGVFGLKVPSVIISEESNIVLNPNHPEFSNQVKIKEIERLELDKRFSK